MPKKPFNNTSRQAGGDMSQRGATVVEFAFVAGIVFLIIFAILEFGLVFLQEHYVANAAREAARIGVRANNYNSFGNNTKRNDCLNSSIENWRCTDRQWRTQRVVTDYLDIFYDQSDINVNVGFGNKSLIVNVTIDSGDIKKSGLIPFSHDIEFTTSMEYEDQKEYEQEHP